MLAWGSSALLNCLPCGTNAARLAHLHLWARGGLKGGRGGYLLLSVRVAKLKAKVRTPWRTTYMVSNAISSKAQSISAGSSTSE